MSKVLLKGIKLVGLIVAAALLGVLALAIFFVFLYGSDYVVTHYILGDDAKSGMFGISISVLMVSLPLLVLGYFIIKGTFIFGKYAVSEEGRSDISEFGRGFVVFLKYILIFILCSAALCYIVALAGPLYSLLGAILIVLILIFISLIR